MVKQYLKQEVARAARLFWEKGLSPGNDSGDISLRDAETGYIYICPRPSEKLKIPNWGVTRTEDIIVIDIEGKFMEETDILPTVEAPMHIHIYKSRPKINAIVHSHAVWSSAFAVAGKNIPPVLDEQDIVFGGEVVCAEYGEVGSEKLARNIDLALGKDRIAALMRNHGAVCIGKNLEEAFIASDFLEKCAQTLIFAGMIGNFDSFSR